MDTPEHTLAIQRLVDTGKPYHVVDSALIEAIFILEKVKEISRPIICQAIQVIFSEPNIRCNRELFEQAFEDYVQFSDLSFVDCYLAATAKISENIPLLSFDKALAKRLPYQVSLVPSDPIVLN